MNENRLTTNQIIRWWELRRLLFDGLAIAVGTAAIVAMEWLMNVVIPNGADAVDLVHQVSEHNRDA